MLAFNLVILLLTLYVAFNLVIFDPGSIFLYPVKILQFLEEYMVGGSLISIYFHISL